IVGAPWSRRRLVDAAAAFAGYARCDERAEVRREGYLSAYSYSAEFRRHLESTGSTPAYAGPCWAAPLWFDLDVPEDLEQGRLAAVRLCETIMDRYESRDTEPLIFFSGAKGFHVGLPTSLWAPEPSPTFHKVARRFAERVAEAAGVPIDTAVYDKVRAFRAP